MKKAHALLMAIITILTLAAFSTGLTLAYFTDRDSAIGTDVSAGSLEVSVDLVLANYGVPGDTLLTSVNKDTPGKSTVTVTNRGSKDMDYTLSLTINEETAYLLDTNGFRLRDVEDRPLQFIGEPTTDSDRNVIYVYESTDVLKNGESDVFGLALTFKGVTLPEDGNNYQNKPISITPMVIATQTGGAE